MGNSQQKLRAKASKLQTANQTLEFDNQFQQTRIKELENKLDAISSKVDSIKKIDNCAQTEQIEQETTAVDKLCDERDVMIKTLNGLIEDNVSALNELKTKSITLSEKDLKILNQRLQLSAQNKLLTKQRADLKTLKSRQTDSELTKKVANQRVTLNQYHYKIVEYKKQIDSSTNNPESIASQSGEIKDLNQKLETQANELKTLNQRFTRLATERDLYRDQSILLKQNHDKVYSLVEKVLHSNCDDISLKLADQLYELYTETCKKLDEAHSTHNYSSNKASVKNTKDDGSYTQQVKY